MADIHGETKSRRDAQIVLSRTDPELVVRLFEQEVAEMRDGVVTIRVIARASFPSRSGSTTLRTTNADDRMVPSGLRSS